MIFWLILFGSLVGFSLGLTGGGGAIFAVPLLVFGLGVPAREAVGVSLVTVGLTALVGFIQRTRRGLVEFATGLLFALAGMLGAPIGTWLSGRIPESILLGLFAIVMLTIAVRMWRTAGQLPADLPILPVDDAGPTCRRDPEGKLRLTSPCAMLLAIIGLGAGILTGLFGVGGGFIIVPALIVFSGMSLPRAVGTSLLVITLVSSSGIVSYLLAGMGLPLTTAVFFTAGSIVGLFGGTLLAKRLAGTALQRTFAAAIFGVAVFVIAQNFNS